MMYKMFGIKVYAMEVGNLMTIVCCDLLIVSGFVCLHKPWFSVCLESPALVFLQVPHFCVSP